MRTCLFLLWCGVAAVDCRAATFQEEFASDPAPRGWNILGETNLFHWNATNQDLAATWDSSRTNSYFFRRLGTVLTKGDDFSLAFDLRLSDIVIGVNSNKPSTFELAIGFLNFADATGTNFARGVGVNASSGPRNLMELAYFPDSGFGATVSPTLVSSNNQFAAGFDFPLELTVGDLFHVAMTYIASNQTLSTVMTRNDLPFGPVKDVKLAASFTDFRLDTLGVNSYTDAGADGSILAHGTVDNFVVSVPDPPILNLKGLYANGTWEGEFTSHTLWLYTLQRSDDLRSWSAASPSTAGTGGKLVLSDTNAGATRNFYRLRADRP